MIRSLIAATSLILAIAGSPSAASEGFESPGAPASPGAISADAASAPAKQGSGQMPAEIRFPSAVGEVVFLHQKHIVDRGMPCTTCHHQINAKKLATPHPDYLKSSWINCITCHNGTGKAPHQVYACSGCHRTNPQNIADETLSAKVVVHKQCWKCHQVGTGKDASTRCAYCHSGKKAS